jgi:hypothetical protein
MTTASLTQTDPPQVPSCNIKDHNLHVIPNRNEQSARERERNDTNIIAGKKSFEDAILDISSFRKIEIPERKAFLAPWLKENSIAMIYGKRGCGKTFFALGILLQILKGKAFGPWQCELSGTCLFLDGEMTISDDKERFESMGFYNEDIKGSFLVYSDHFANHLGLPRANLANEEWRSKFKKFLLDKKVKLLVIDNIASLCPDLMKMRRKIGIQSTSGCSTCVFTELQLFFYTTRAKTEISEEHLHVKIM